MELNLVTLINATPRNSTLLAFKLNSFSSQFQCAGVLSELLRNAISGIFLERSSKIVVFVPVKITVN